MTCSLGPLILDIKGEKTEVRFCGRPRGANGHCHHHHRPTKPTEPKSLPMSEGVCMIVDPDGKDRIIIR